MAEKMLNTRIQLRYDSLTNWNTQNPILKKGEVAVAYLATSEMKDGTSGAQHPVLFKVGDGTSDFKTLPWASALAADVYSWAKKSEAEFTTWVKSLINVTDIDTYSKGEIDSKFTANSSADQTYAKNYADSLAVNYDAAGSAAAAESAAKTHAETKATAAETAAKSYADSLIADLDATASQTAGADGLALSVTEVDGKITAISGSIAANTYDAYGSAAAAESAAKSHAETKASAAETAAKSHANSLNTAMDTRVKALEDHKDDYKAYADQAEADAIASAKDYTNAQIASTKTEISTEIDTAITESATSGAIASVEQKADAAQEAAKAAQETANEGVTKAEAAQIAADAAQKTIDDFLKGEGLDDTVDTLKEIQAELEALGEAVQLESQFATKADKTITITGTDGLEGGGDLSANREIKLTAATKASLALANSAVQPTRKVSAGQGLTGGGALNEDQTIALNSATIASLALADSAVQPGVLTSTLANYYTKTAADAEFMNAAEVNTAISNALTGENASVKVQNAVNADEATHAVNADKATDADNLGGTAAADYALKTYVDSAVNGLATGAVATNTSSISTINATLATYGNIVTHNVAEFATAAQGTKADSALQEITTTANGGLKVINKNQVDIDTSVIFVFNCGDAAGNSLT